MQNNNDSAKKIEVLERNSLSDKKITEEAEKKYNNVIKKTDNEKKAAIQKCKRYERTITTLQHQLKIRTKQYLSGKAAKHQNKKFANKYKFLKRIVKGKEQEIHILVNECKTLKQCKNEQIHILANESKPKNQKNIDSRKRKRSHTHDIDSDSDCF